MRFVPNQDGHWYPTETLPPYHRAILVKSSFPVPSALNALSHSPSDASNLTAELLAIYYLF